MLINSCVVCYRSLYCLYIWSICELNVLSLSYLCTYYEVHAVGVSALPIALSSRSQLPIAGATVSGGWVGVHDLVFQQGFWPCYQWSPSSKQGGMCIKDQWNGETLNGFVPCSYSASLNCIVFDSVICILYTSGIILFSKKFKVKKFNVVMPRKCIKLTNWHT